MDQRDAAQNDLQKAVDDLVARAEAGDKVAMVELQSKYTAGELHGLTLKNLDTGHTFIFGDPRGVLKAASH